MPKKKNIKNKENPSGQAGESEISSEPLYNSDQENKNKNIIIEKKENSEKVVNEEEKGKLGNINNKKESGKSN
jgi:hypothetical protein